MTRSRPPRRSNLYITTLTLFALLTTVLSSSIDIDNVVLQPRSNSSKPFLLRIMPLGASITVGYRSSDGNGYRKWLREQLRYGGWDVDMVGGLANGTMKDNQNEGHYGDTIDGVASAALASAALQPNVILINLGTNDGLQNNDIRDADSRIDTLMSDLFTSIPNTTIILSTLLPNTHAQRVVSRISKEYRALAARRRANGDRVVLAEMSYFIGSDQLADGTHPDDQGYKNMAAVWWAAVQVAESEGLLVKPNEMDLESGGRLAEVSGVNGTMKEGEGLDDGPVVDPELPAYIAPAQPGEEGTGGAWRAGGDVVERGVWVVLGVVLVGLMK